MIEEIVKEKIGQKDNSFKKFRGYHYTTLLDYESMQNGRTYRKKGLLPIGRFINLGEGNCLPKDAHEGCISCLLEPEPQSWVNNKQFPYTWISLMSHLCLKDNSLSPELSKLVLLSFEILCQDNAYVVERAHIEKWRAKNQTKKQEKESYTNYWNSRVSVSEYKGNYNLPELAIFSYIPIDRLKLESEKPISEVWEQLRKYY